MIIAVPSRRRSVPSEFCHKAAMRAGSGHAEYLTSYLFYHNRMQS